MTKLKWLLENKLVLLSLTSLLAGVGWGGQIFIDSISKNAYDRGVAFEKAVCLEEYKRELKLSNEKYEAALKASNDGYRQLIALRLHCKNCCPNGCED